MSRPPSLGEKRASAIGRTLKPTIASDPRRVHVVLGDPAAPVYDVDAHLAVLDLLARSKAPPARRPPSTSQSCILRRAGRRERLERTRTGRGLAARAKDPPALSASGCACRSCSPTRELPACRRMVESEDLDRVAGLASDFSPRYSTRARTLPRRRPTARAHVQRAAMHDPVATALADVKARPMTRPMPLRPLSHGGRLRVGASRIPREVSRLGLAGGDLENWVVPPILGWGPPLRLAAHRSRSHPGRTSCSPRRRSTSARARARSTPSSAA